ncbi:MAG: Valine--pyruvate aminotransferase (EC [uncultured Thiotrichaceae bacterium]|uniref:Valine--pyruvate aminotransferase (EC) n=1 Tax=uncultured Thiotrichaceae bacterium TaxID=298394 RepID=A0A6S6U2Q4_9GAMM|nr:MAG: Valine--pyruvate aminotransferase (EC [uncultured Thiotrichaceae bacterium]
MQYSNFGEKFTRPNGISQLMDDLGKANQSDNPDLIMLGGGNPAIVPEAHKIFLKECKQLHLDGNIDAMLALYDGPQGNEEFIQALADMLASEYAWDISADNILLTNGSQSSFFSIFNLFAGDMPDGSHKKVLFPLTPEYVGYADQGLSENMFTAAKPEIHILDNQQFKYGIDFDALPIDDSIGAVCVSRPTNPTGNVVTDDEITALNTLASKQNVPLIIDNAYGLPFPGAIYVDANLSWNQNMILCMSISKMGLPGLRTGIIIANKERIKALRQISGIMTLAPSSAGPTLLTRIVQNKELIPLCQNFIKPYYENKAETAVRLFNEIFSGMPIYLHKLEGAFFMWLWFKDYNLRSEEIYQRLKTQDVYIIPGHNFFMGIEDSWEHKHQCVRINYAKDEAVLRKGLLALRDVIQNGEK